MRVLLTVSGIVKIVFAGFVLGVLLGLRLAGLPDEEAAPSCAPDGACVVRTIDPSPDELSAPVPR